MRRMWGFKQVWWLGGGQQGASGQCKWGGVMFCNGSHDWELLQDDGTSGRGGSDDARRKNSVQVGVWGGFSGGDKNWSSMSLCRPLLSSQTQNEWADPHSTSVSHTLHIQDTWNICQCATKHTIVIWGWNECLRSEQHPALLCSLKGSFTLRQSVMNSSSLQTQKEKVLITFCWEQFFFLYLLVFVSVAAWMLPRSFQTFINHSNISFTLRM